MYLPYYLIRAAADLSFDLVERTDLKIIDCKSYKYILKGNFMQIECWTVR